MESYVIAIPSYKRADRQPTVEYMAGLGIPKEQIFLFVQTERDRNEYARYSDRATIIYAQANGIAQARNNILNTLIRTTNVLMMDDDVCRIGRLRGDKIEPYTDREELAHNLNLCFSNTKKNGAEIFGLYPVYNPFFMSQTISTRVAVNTVIGFTKGMELRFDETYDAKEDIELCARVLHEGGNVMRYNFFAPDAKHRTNKGGCCDTWATDANRKAVERLCEAYPDILAENSRKQDEVRVIAKDKKTQLRKR